MTLQTIADALGVSRSTVSNAYNRPDQLAPALRERILAAAGELGYAGPDPAARRLRSGRRDAVGLLFDPEALADQAAVLVLQGIARATQAAGVGLLLAGDVRGAVVDALCLHALPAGHPGVAAALERRLPIVVIDAPRLDGHAFVGVDERAGARRAAEHLTVLGHRRFAVLGAAGERLRGYRDVLERDGLSWAPVGRDGIAAALSADPRPTAVLAAADDLALRAMEAARDRGLAIPQDLSVVGFDDVPDAARAGPGLTTIRQPLREKGEVAGRLLVAGALEREVILPVELVVRGSTAPPPGR